MNFKWVNLLCANYTSKLLKKNIGIAQYKDE